MAIPELELKRATVLLEKFCGRLPANSRRHHTWHWKVRGHVITLFERRPVWRAKPGEFSENNLARFQFDPASYTWMLKCADPNGRFRAHEGFESVRNFEKLLAAVESDPAGVFRR